MVQLWKHTSLPLARKLHAFQAIILSQVLHGLDTAWLNVSDRRKLDGFQCRCLRVILRIPPPYVSRVSNQTVLARAGAVKFFILLLRHQLILFGKVARAPDQDVLRQLTFCPGCLDLAANRFIRRVGRPRNEWASCLLKEAIGIAGSQAALEIMVQRPAEWKAAVWRHCSQPR